jgi:protein-S-isoprenylcysteine O-methyltransferase Ste14
MKKRMNILGIGIYMIVAMVPCVIMITVLTSVYSQVFHYTYIPRFIGIILGAILMIFGVLFLSVSLRIFMKQFATGKLVMNGPFALCRNPIYASWILFIIPGISLLLDSWLILTASLLMYILFKLKIGKEEQDLREAFGAEYLAYKESVNELIPLPRIRNNHKPMK